MMLAELFVCEPKQCHACQPRKAQMSGAKIQTRMTDRNRTFTTQNVRYPLQLRRPRWLCESPVNPVGSVSPMRRLGVLRPGRSTQFVRTCGPIIIARPP